MQTNAPKTQSRVVPTQTLLTGKPYNRNTDVQDTWKRFGWVPPSEQKVQQ